ncbi:hypothetical protein D8S78_23360 [Natrialba swarupiae]|nr:hypothetical protein [Natrialba swarupiae]
MDQYGLETDDVYLSYGEGGRALRDGDVDAWFVFHGSDAINAFVTDGDELEPEFDDEAMEGLQEVFPWTVEADVTPDMLENYEETTGVMGTHGYWMTTPEMDDDVVYELCRVVTSNPEPIRDSNVNSEEFDSSSPTTTSASRITTPQSSSSKTRAYSNRHEYICRGRSSSSNRRRYDAATEAFGRFDCSVYRIRRPDAGVQHVPAAGHVLMLTLVYLFLRFPLRETIERELSDRQIRLCNWFDIAMIVGSTVTYGYLILNSAQIIEQAGRVQTFEIPLGFLAMFVVLEATRRTIGWTIPLFATGFLVYVYLGPAFPGIFSHPGYSTNQLIVQMYVSTRGCSRSRSP